MRSSAIAVGTAPSVAVSRYVGESRAVSLRLIDRRTRTPLDLTGRTVRATVRATIGEGAPLARVTTGAGITHLSAGRVSVALPGALAAGSYVWDLWVDEQLVVAPSPLVVGLPVRALDSVLGAVAFATGGALAADGSIVASSVVNGAVALAAGAALQSSGDVVVDAAVVLPTGGALTAAGQILVAGGAVFGVGAALSATPDADLPLFPMTAAESAALHTGLGSTLGADSYIWPYNEAAGSAFDTVEGEELAPTASPHYRVVPTEFPDEFGILLDVDTNDRLTGSSSLMNATDEFMWRKVIEFVPMQPSSLVTVFEKFAGGIGYILTQDTDGSLDWQISSAAATQIINVPTNHAGETHLIDCGRTGSTIYLRTGHALVTVTLTATGDITNAGVFRDGRFLSAGALLIHSEALLGAACSAANDNDWTVYANHLGAVVGAA